MNGLSGEQSRLELGHQISQLVALGRAQVSAMTASGADQAEHPPALVRSQAKDVVASDHAHLANGQQPDHGDPAQTGNPLGGMTERADEKARGHRSQV
ncbi:MAG: hypothetical protein QOF83_4129 [Solirubrobacteraceae bacterium]|nr:hypothetical protein [Solirubrobacteraceae bacterium]